MITQSYSSEKASLFHPGAFLGERNYICDTAIVTFSHEILSAVLERYPHKQVSHNCSVNGHRPIYLLGAALPEKDPEAIFKSVKDKEEITKLALYGEITGKETIAAIDEKLLEFFK